jgi:hypothetical protein
MAASAKALLNPPSLRSVPHVLQQCGGTVGALVGGNLVVEGDEGVVQTRADRADGERVRADCLHEVDEPLGPGHAGQHHLYLLPGSGGEPSIDDRRANGVVRHDGGRTLFCPAEHLDLPEAVEHLVCSGSRGVRVALHQLLEVADGGAQLFLGHPGSGGQRRQASHLR